MYYFPYFVWVFFLIPRFPSTNPTFGALVLSRPTQSRFSLFGQVPPCLPYRPILFVPSSLFTSRRSFPSSLTPPIPIDITFSPDSSTVSILAFTLLGLTFGPRTGLSSKQPNTPPPPP